MSFQLNHPNTSKRMILRAYIAMPVVQVAVDSTPPDRVSGIIGIGHGKALQDAELRFDKFSHEASVGVHTGWMCSLRMKAKTVGWS